jgi:5-formyltetrahydrofolate cyclo-ligase
MPDSPNKKATARSRLANDRSTLGDECRTELARKAVRRLLDAPEMATARRVAAYQSFGHEPATDGLLAELLHTGREVLLPVMLPDLDLGWARYTGPGALRPARFGLREPVGERLGVDAVLAVDVLVVPALAVDARGVRLGRGGGSYDRVLSRIGGAAPRPWVVALLYDGEVGIELPVEPHDRAVDAAASPSGVRRFGVGRSARTSGHVRSSDHEH